MNQQPITEAQLRALLQFAAKKLDTTPEKLASVVSGGSENEIEQKLTNSQAQALHQLIRDPNKVNELLRSPAVMKLLKQMQNDG